MLAPQDIEGGDAQGEESARFEDASELGEGFVFLAAGQMDDDVHGNDRVEGLVLVRQLAHIGLDHPLDAERFAELEALPAEIEGIHRPVVALLEGEGEVSGAGSDFGNAAKLPFPGGGIEQAEHNLAHAAIPPESVLGFSDISEFSRVHHKGAFLVSQIRN